MNTNCKNCGAPLSGGKCDYCATEYGNDPARVVMCGEKVGALVVTHHINGDMFMFRTESGKQKVFVPAYKMAEFFT